MTTTMTDRATDFLNQIKDEVADMDPDDWQKVSEHVSLLVLSFTAMRAGLRSRRAVKRGDWPEATYYLLSGIGTQLALRWKITDMRRKGLIK